MTTENIKNNLVLTKHEESSNKFIDEILENEYLEYEHLQKLLPNIELSKQDVDEVNAVLKVGNTDKYSELLSMLIEHRHILEHDDCKSIKHYLECLKYISYTMAGIDIVDAYIRAKSTVKRVQQLAIKNDDESKLELEKEAILFGKSRLVVRIQAAMDYPLHLLFAGYRHQAITILRNEMNTAKLSRDRITAADRLLFHLQPLQEQVNTTNIMINSINAKDNPIEQYKEAMRMLASEQQSLIQSNKDIDISKVINVKTTKVEDK